jgi:hypothetical protein
MITRLVSVLLLGSPLLVPALAPAAGTIQLIVESYDYTPGKATNTWGYGVANNGTVVGQYNHKATAGSFTRTSKGHFSHPILFPGAVTTDATGVNRSGLVCGSFEVDEGVFVTHGFFFDGTTYTQFDLPGYDNTFVTGVNDAGDFVGYGVTGSLNTGFVSISGVITTFSGPGGVTISPQAINNLGQIVGYYSSPTSAHGFFRDADGTLTYPIDYPASLYTSLDGINDAGLIVGTYTKAGFITSGLVVQNLNLFTSYDHPDALNNVTVFRGINNSNIISGFYLEDASGSGVHAFIARFAR